MCGIAGMFDLSGQREAPGRRRACNGPGHLSPRSRRRRLPHTPRLRNRKSAALHRRARGRQATHQQRRSHSLDRLQRRTLRLPRKEAAARSQGARLPHAHRHGTDPAPVGRPPREDARTRPRAVRHLPVGQQNQRGDPRPRPCRHLPAVLHDRQTRRHELAAVRLGNEGVVRVGVGRA